MINGSESNQRALVFYDDIRARAFEPFALSRPFSEMRAGALLIRERWEWALRARTFGFVGATHLVSFSETGAASFFSGVIPAGTVLVNSRAAVALSDDSLAWMRKEDKENPEASRTWYIGGVLAAVQLRASLDSSLLRDGARTLDEIALLDLAQNSDSEDSAQSSTESRVDVSGVWIDEVWDIVKHLSPMLNADIPLIAEKLHCHAMSGPTQHTAHISPSQILGEHKVFSEKGANVEPFVVFDTSAGPILLREGSTVQSFTRVVGPCYVGRDSMLMGERISGSSIGDTCRVHGELSATVFVGFANKGHDGFVGHSIVGRWVNMGAGTITSNLKNTYGTVALWTPVGIRDTKMQFLGTLFGDHAKTGIGMKLTTGCVLGMGANVFDRMPPKAVEPFAWGSGAPYDSYDVSKFIDTAARMMSRRHVELSEHGKQAIRDSHAARWHTRS